MSRSTPIFRLQAFSIILIVLFAGGCAARSPEVRPPVTGLAVPQAWTALDMEPDAGDSLPWWQYLGDTRLESIITEALDHNRDLRAAAERVLLAASEARAAGAALNPEITVGLNAARQRQNLSGFPAFPGLEGAAPDSPIVSLNNNFGLSLNTSWEADIWGRIRDGAGGAIAQFEAQQADYAAARLSLAGQSAKLWFALAEAHLQLALAETTVESYRETARLAADRVEAGIQNPSDGHLAAANLAQAEALLAERRRTADALARQMEILLGRYPDGSFAPVDVLPELPATPSAGVPADIVRQRPDILAAERRLAAAIAQTGAAEKALYPSLRLTGSNGTASDSLRNLLRGDFLVWSIAGNLLQPIFQGGRLRARVESAEAREREALETFAARLLDAYAEVETALAGESFLRDRAGHFAVAAAEAANAVRVAADRYGQGVDPLLVVLEAQRRALDAGSASLAVRRALLENRIDLHLALGGTIP